MSSQIINFILFSLWIAGWLALLVAPLNHRICWVFARTCAILLACICVLHVGSFAIISEDVTCLLAGKIAEPLLDPACKVLVAELLLSFHLFIGSWQVEDSKLHAISHRRLVPFLLLTCIFPPLGFLAHMMMRDIQKIRLARRISTYSKNEIV
jgi:succinate dehydrogenase hydrophobic anchor subunit